MGESRLDKGLRALAWTALVATLLALIGVGIFLQPPLEADETNENVTPTAMTPGAAEETE